MRLVLKIGGSVLEPEPAPALLEAIARLAGAGVELLIVHGGGKALTRLLAQLGVRSEFRRGLRVTDAATLQAALMVFAGTVNKGLVAGLNAAAARLGAGRLRAVGLTGLDGESVVARIEDAEMGRVGAVHATDPALPLALLRAGFTPVVAPLAADGAGGVLNVNADQFASACAVAIAADRLIFITDVAGVLDGNGACIPEIALTELEDRLGGATVSGGMLPKLAACREALAGGVAGVEIVGATAALRLDAWAGRSCPGTRLVGAVR